MAEALKFFKQESQPGFHLFFTFVSSRQTDVSPVYYLLRSQMDGQYLTARPNPGAGARYVLLFREHFEALSYLNQHGAEVADQFSVESIPGTQLMSLLKRWEFAGMGIVQEPLLPTIEFFSVS